MAVRVRKNGRVLCAAMHTAEEGDIYIDDTLHYLLSVEAKVLVTTPHEQHKKDGQWYWATQIPSNIVVDNFYKS